MLPSLGSVFKRPNELISAGELIDKAGLKGQKVGGCEINSMHANFIVNNGNGTAEDYKKLSNLMKNRVKELYDVELKLEVEYID